MQDRPGRVGGFDGCGCCLRVHFRFFSDLPLLTLGSTLGLGCEGWGISGRGVKLESRYCCGRYLGLQMQSDARTVRMFGDSGCL